MGRSTEPGAYDIQRIKTLEDIDRIRFHDGMAAVEVPISLVRQIRFKNHLRGPSPRLTAVESSIRDKGYRPLEPIIIRIGQKGRWIVVDGGHRLTAALEVDDEFWPNLFHRRVGNMYFLLFATARSWTKLKRKVAPAIADDPVVNEIFEKDFGGTPGQADEADAPRNAHGNAPGDVPRDAPDARRTGDADKDPNPA